MITQADKDAIVEVVDAFEGAFISGSYLVDKDKANDIDVVVPLLAWNLWVERNKSDTSILSSDIADVRFEAQVCDAVPEYDIFLEGGQMRDFIASRDLSTDDFKVFSEQVRYSVRQKRMALARAKVAIRHMDYAEKSLAVEIAYSEKHGVSLSAF